ncbi:MAG: hypothetical protein K6V97_09755 [Actinomycetia bacterium]|nr:hypothetical protein [Actinomycetes bacterium]
MACGLAGYVRLRYRVVFENAPVLAGPLVVAANHQSDAEVLVLPLYLYRHRRGRAPLVVSATQRLFEPGFLASRLPPYLARLWGSRPLAGLLYAAGVWPVENEPYRRSFASVAAEVRARWGDLVASAVFAPDALAAVFGPGAEQLRLSALIGPEAARPAQAVVPWRAIREPYRQALQDATRPRITAQLTALAEALQQGAILLLTPEGHVTETGRMRPWGRAFGQLVAAAGGRWLAAGVSVDPFYAGPVTVWIRFGEPDPDRPPEDVVRGLRPFTPSQLLARWAEAEGRVAWSEAEAVAAVRRQLAEGAADGAVGPLRRNPEEAVRRTLGRLVARGVLARAGSRYERTGRVRDARLAGAANLWTYLAAQAEETLAVRLRDHEDTATGREPSRPPAGRPPA